MNKKIIMPIALLTLFSLVVFVYAQNVETSNIGSDEAGNPIYDYTFKIYKGWNLVPMVYYSRGDIGCGAGFKIEDNRMINDPSNQHLKYAFVWTPTQKGYVGGALDAQHTLNLNSFSGEDREYLATAINNFVGTNPLTGQYDTRGRNYISTYTTWIYSDADCTLGRTDEGSKLTIAMTKRENSGNTNQVDEDLSKIKLQKGWNIGMVMPLMYEGDKLSDYFSECQIERFAIWEPDTQKWNLPSQENLQENLLLVSPTEEGAGIGQETGSGRIQPNYYYRSFAIKVADECSLSYSGGSE